ncbi:MAG: alpha/beta hydrolase [Acidimicrobiales bacterium]
MGDAKLHLIDVEAETVGAPVPLAVVTPPGFDPGGASLPLCRVLHGGGGDRSKLEGDLPFIEAAWADGEIVPMVFVTASTGPLSWYGGDWEDFIAEELPTIMADRFNTRTDPAGSVMTGRSMGGFGTLKIALKRPDQFAAIAALEPAIEPGLRRDEATPRNSFYRFADVDHALWGDPVDQDRWAADNPANIATENATTIRESGLEIYLECGDQDSLNLHDGAEFMHRTLWDLDVRHEFHLVRWADHVGTSFARRVPEALRFLSDALSGGLSAPTGFALNAEEQAWVDWVRGGMVGEPVQLSLSTERGPAMMAIMNEAKKTPAMELDPTFARSYGVMGF